MKRLSRVLELTSLLAGAALFLYVVRRAGPAVLMEYLGTIGWGFAGLLLVSAARHGFRTLAWGASLGAPARLGELYLVRLAGESVRGLTVLGPILGEPAKVWLLRRTNLTTGSIALAENAILSPAARSSPITSCCSRFLRCCPWSSSSAPLAQT